MHPIHHERCQSVPHLLVMSVVMILVKIIDHGESGLSSTSSSTAFSNITIEFGIELQQVKLHLVTP